MLVSQIGPSLLSDLKNGTKLFFKNGVGVWSWTNFIDQSVCKYN